MADWILAGRYLMGEVIGSGGMAMVYKAARLGTGEIVAIKMLRAEYLADEEYVRQFRKEMQICMEHHHRNIVDTLEIGEEQGRLYIVMEYVEGHTLEDYIQKHAPLSHQETVEIAVQICDALYYAHCHKLVHRDIKPQNILITSSGTAKVTDFGIARSAQLSTVTVAGDKVMGSVHYLSPEQARGGVVDHKSDLYAMGIVLYEMVTGKLPFTGDTPVAVVMKQIQEQPVPPRRLVPTVEKSMEAVIAKAMQKDPAQRYESARELANDLTRSLRDPEGLFVAAPETPVQAGSGNTLRFEKVRVKNPENADEPPSKVMPRDRSAGRKKTPRSVFLLAVLLIILAGVLVGGAFYMKNQSKRAEKLTRNVVPEVAGYTADEVQLLFEEAKIKATLIEEFSNAQPAGFAVRCEPGVGTTVDDTVTVTVYISKGTEKVNVPILEGYSLEEAEALLKEQELKVGNVRQSNTMDKPDNQVIQQDPASGTAVEKGTGVDLWISKNTQTSIVMEKFTGQTENDVLVRLEELGLVPGQITRVESDAAAGTVIQQEPEEGADILVGGTVRLWISKGSSSESEDSDRNPEEVTVTIDKKTHILIHIIEDGRTTVFEDQVRDAGSYVYDVTPENESSDPWEIVVYLDGEVAERRTVTP